jgi:hypothetical protein
MRTTTALFLACGSLWFLSRSTLAAPAEAEPEVPAAAPPADAPPVKSVPDAAAAPVQPDGAPAADTTAAAAAPPAAAPTPRRKRKVFPKLRQASLVHDMQFGIALLSGTGYRGIFPYQDGVYCGQLDAGSNARVCSSRLPIFIDVQPSFGVSTHWDLLVDLRFGVEADFTNTHQFAVAPGFRYWVDPELPVKFFATVQVAYDTTPQHDAAIKRNNDVALRNSDGVMFEVMRNLGFYAQFGETIGFVRWFRIEIDLGVGVQARFP